MPVLKRLACAIAACLACLPALAQMPANASDAARQRFADVFAARETAREAEAGRLAGPTWTRAEERLAQAAERLERGDGDGAQARAVQALELYREAGRQAVAATVLTTARSKVLELGQAGATRWAPRTSARARELLDAATAELAADPAGRATAERLAAEAVDAARRALSIATYLRAAREADRSNEDLVAAWQDSLARAAAAAGTPLEATAAPDQAGDALAAALRELATTGREQAETLAQRGRQIAALEEEIRELDRRLATAGSEARSLGERLEARERAAEQYARLERAFPAGEVVVLRQADAIIVRLQGLSFASGSAQLPQSGRRLLASFREVLNIYPRASFAVEGHTDSSGDSAANQALSQKRADAVGRYLATELGIPKGRISTVGYGNSRPIASNAAADGRRENRRIDVVLDTGESNSP